MTNQFEQISVGHIGRAAEALDGLLPAIDDAISAHHRADQLLYLPDSRAAEDSTLRFATHIHDMLGGVGLYYGSILDSASALADIGRRALLGEETPIYVPHSVSRSIVELFAQMHWLLDPELTSKDRVARSLSIRRRDARGAVRFGLSSARLDHIDEQASAIGLKKVGRGDRRAYEQDLPGYGAMVKGMLGDETYSLLSGVSHGEMWAIIQLGYAKTGASVWAGTGQVLRKQAPAYGQWLAILTAVRAFAAAVPRDFEYRGWDVSELRPKLQAALRTARDMSVPNA